MDAGVPVSLHSLSGRVILEGVSGNEGALLNVAQVPTGTYLVMVDGEFLTVLSIID